MSDADSSRGQVVASAAEVYEEFFVPALFAQWVPVVLDAVSASPGDRLLDVGCGTGIVARSAYARVGTSGRVVGLDRNEGMLAVARRAREPVTWQHGVAEALPFPDGSFDRVVCQFVAMFLDDRTAAAQEMARVLAPSGSTAIATWADVDESPGYAAMLRLLDRVVGAEAANAFAAPFSLGTPDAVRAVLADSFVDVVVTRHEGTARFASIDAWVHTEIRGWTLAGQIDDATYERFLQEARDALGGFVDPATGAVAFAAPALVAVGKKG